MNLLITLNRTIQLLQVQDQQVIDAILTEVTDKHLEDARTLWEPILEGSGQDDEYWNWIGIPGALGFYRKLRLGLLNCGPDPEEPDHLVYFETLRMDHL